MHAVVKLPRRTNQHAWPSSSSLTAHLEKSAWFGIDRFCSSRNSGAESSRSWESDDNRPGPSVRKEDVDWWARDSKAQAQAMALLSAALDEADEGQAFAEGEGAEAVAAISEEYQKSLRVGVVGSPNAGKSTLTNHVVGSKVSAVSRKTNTTHKEHMGILSKGDSQLGPSIENGQPQSSAQRLADS